MFTTSNVSKFSSAFGKVAKFSQPRATLPILGFILMDTTTDSLFLSATNLEQTCFMKIDDVEVNKQGSICIPAKTAAGLFSAWDDDALVAEVTERTMKATITSGKKGKSKAELKGITSAEFPPYRSMLRGDFRPEATITVGTKAFREVVSRLATFASSDQQRPILTGIHFKLKGNVLTLEAADGFRLGQDVIEVENASNVEFNQTVPARPVLDLAKIAEADTITIGYDKDSGSSAIRFLSGNVEIAVTPIDGNYPDVQQIIPTDTNVVASFNTDTLLSAVKRARVVVDSDVNIMRLTLDYEAKTAIINTQSDEVGNQVETIELEGLEVFSKPEVEGDPNVLIVGLNITFIESILATIDDSRFDLIVNSPTQPIVLKVPSLKSYIGLVMPMHLNK